MSHLLATLNSRETLSEKLGGISVISVSGNSNATTDSSTKASNGRHTPVVVNINRNVEDDYELGILSSHKPSSNT
ncbi:hypothetical protein C0991_009869 [Blastosporella zonata]|nr:hypothetical protein C0991_009869 [Blastosporella zonata]